MRKSDVVSYFGSQVKVAEALGIKPSAVCQWDEIIPPLRSFQIERLTSGALSVGASKESKQENYNVRS
ncbi:Cro/CI family transcriptional regulator [Zooshikella sp. RANM57]|uniref:Cro/CI family transcriptional regulator n=1 Tax=Zooshikella sp. RANM57 TaxID=3425863 RepID=UPI003D6DFA5F